MNADNLDGLSKAMACLARTYDIIYNVDLDTEECEELYLASAFEKTVTDIDPVYSERNYSERMYILASTAIVREDFKNFVDSTSVERVKKELGTKEVYTVNYRVNSTVGIKYYQTKYVRNSFLGGNNVIGGIRDCTEEFKSDLSATIIRKGDEVRIKDDLKRNPAAISAVKPNTIDKLGLADEPQTQDEADEKKQLKKVLEPWVYGLSHGIRTPLNSLLGYITVIDKYRLDHTKFDECIVKLKESCKSILSLIDEMVVSSGIGADSVRTIDIESEQTGKRGLDRGLFTLAGRRVLIVEDNELNREMAREILEQYRMIVEEASDGAVAVDMVYNSNPGYYDFILMDIQMPYMDGYEAAREIRKLEDKQLAQIPIVALSANIFESDEMAKAAGMNERLTKPVNIEKLLKVLQKYNKIQVRSDI